MANEQIVKMFEHVDFAGQYRYLYKDTPSFSKEGYTVSSIIVEAGPGWNNHVVNFYEHNDYGGGLL